MVNKNVLLAAAAVGGGYYLKNSNVNLMNLFNKEEETFAELPLIDENNRSIKKLVLPELKITFEKDSEGIEWKKSENLISLEEFDSERKNKMKFYDIGKKTKWTPYVNGLKIFGGVEVRKYKIEYNESVPELIKENVSKLDTKLGIVDFGDEVEIDSPEEIVKKFQNKFRGKDFKLSSKNLELIYYLPEGSNILIPMYQIGNAQSGPTKGDANVLGLVFPANQKYDNNFRLEGELKYKKEKVETPLLKNDGEEDNLIIENTRELIKYTFTFFAPNTDINKINFIGNLKNVKKSTIGPGKYIFDFESDFNKESLENVLINYVNEFDVSKTVLVELKQEMNNIPTLNNPVPSNIGLALSRDNNEYGIDWGEDVIGGACYSNYVNYMDSKAINRYKWTKPNAWVSDFIDKDNNGFDHLWVDDVDISTYIGHGNGYGFNLEGSGSQNGSLTYWEAAKGKAWGNRDLEYQVWLSCQVLEEVYDGKEWWERWGPTFNGLHLICGFQTNASTGTHKQLKYFAKNVYDNKKTVRKAWFDAADSDQPDGTQAVVMGPLMNAANNPNYQKSQYAAINSSTNGVLRAHWNDVAWNLAGPTKKDLSKENVVGWWRVVHTV
jgi:hypothetical protein